MESIGSSLSGLKQNLNIETVHPAEDKPDESVWALLLNNVRDEKSTKAVRMTRYFNILRQHDNQVGLAGFIPVYKDLMYDHRLTAKDRDIYLALECFDFSSAASPEAPSHEVHPSRELLCALTSSGYETVSRALKRLQETGWIYMEMRAKPSKFGTASIWYYTILRQGNSVQKTPEDLCPGLFMPARIFFALSE